MDNNALTLNLLGTSLPLKQQGQTHSLGKSDTKTSHSQKQDIISLSSKGQETILPQGTRLISENTQTLANGFRKIQNFEQSGGKNFTRTEEFTSDDNRAQRTLIQKNNTGNLTRLEEILDRQPNGAFRLTQHYTNETGKKTTHIEFDVIPKNPNIILGKPPHPTQPSSPSPNTRGQTFDISI